MPDPEGFRFVDIIQPPRFLYHGTSESRANKIVLEGINPYLDSHGERIYGIFLTTNEYDAKVWGGVRADLDNNPVEVVFRIDTRCSHNIYRRAILPGFTRTMQTSGGSWYLTRTHISPDCLVVVYKGSMRGL